MKTLKISREEMEAKFEFCAGGMTYTDNQDEIKQRLLAAGFDMTRRTCRGKDKEGNYIYAQKEHEAEDIETASEFFDSYPSLAQFMRLLEEKEK